MKTTIRVYVCFIADFVPVYQWLFRVAVMNEHGEYQKEHYSFYPAASYNVTDNKLLLPIPQREITIDKLEQNPQ